MKKICTILFVALSALPFTYCSAQSFDFVRFDSLSSGMTSPGAYVLSLAMKDSTQISHLYAGGHFKIAGRKMAINIAEWADTANLSPPQGKWTALGTGADSDVCALQMFNNYLYAGGKFDSAGGIAASHIARWDTALMQWDSLKGKLNGNVYALCIYNNALYVGGDFTMAGGDTVNRIAMWNDSAWAPVGKGFDTGAVYALTVSNDSLYAGGSFIKSNGVAVNHIAKLSGTNWDSLGSGTNNTVYALADYNGSLYVGGAFTKSGGINTNYISVYINNNFSLKWRSIYQGTNDTVRALNAGLGLMAEIVGKQAGQGIGRGNVLLVGGNFDSAGGYASHYIAGLQGGLMWDTIGQLNGPVYALSNPYYYGGNNYVGGEFKYSQSFSFNDTVNNVAQVFIFLGGGISNLSNKYDITAYPNPSTGTFNIIVNSKLSIVNEMHVAVYNILGEQIYGTSLSINNSPFSINLGSSPNGVYLYRITDENGDLIGEGKLVVQK